MDKTLASIGTRLRAYATLCLRPGRRGGTVSIRITAGPDSPVSDMQVREYVYENRMSLIVRTGRDEIRAITCRAEGRVEVVDDRDGGVAWRVLLVPEDDEHAELLRALVECIEIESDAEFSRKSWTDFITSLLVHADGDGPEDAQEFPNREFVEMYAICDDPDQDIVWRDTVVPALRDLGEDITHVSLSEALEAAGNASPHVEGEVEEMIRRADEVFDSLWMDEDRPHA